MTRRDFLRRSVTAGAAAAAMPLAACRTVSRSTPPNIILIIADDVSWDDLGCYGNTGVKTPQLDALAAAGLRFTNVFLTASSCSPSRCSLITGRYPHNTGAAELHTPLPPNQAAFPALLRSCGYYTAQAGKWHMGEAPRSAFDRIEDDAEVNGPGGEAMWLKLLEERPPEKPFFFWLAPYDAHRDWSADDFGPGHDPENAAVPPYMADRPGTRRDLASYYNEIGRIDFHVGELMRELKGQGLESNTLVLFMADNGRPFPRCKTRVYDSGMQTPLIAHWPAGVKVKGGLCSGLISAVDIAPTLLELAGAGPLPGAQGRSFVRLLRDPDQSFRSVVFAEHNWHDFMAWERLVRTPDHLYVYNARPELRNGGPLDSKRSPSHADLLELRRRGDLTKAQSDVFLAPRPAEELYDCRTDPQQLQDLAADPEQAGVLQRMRELLRRWQEETGDTIPERLTPDWYDRITGEALEVKGVRGEMPGAAAGAARNNSPGPF